MALKVRKFDVLAQVVPEILRKNYRGGGIMPPPPILIRVKLI